MNANGRKQAQMDRADWLAGGTGPGKRPALLHGTG